MGALDVQLSEEGIAEIAEIRKVVDAAEVHGARIRMVLQRRHIETVLLWSRRELKFLCMGVDL